MVSRVAKLIFVEIVEKYLWQNKTTLLAVYDGGNSLKQRFEYTLGHVPTSFTQAGQRYYILTDQVGTPKIISDAHGGVIKQIDYDAFGNVISDSNPEFKVPFGFAGRLHDNDTELSDLVTVIMTRRLVAGRREIRLVLQVRVLICKELSGSEYQSFKLKSPTVLFIG